MSIKYQAILGIQSTEFFNFLSGDGTEREKPVKTTSWINIQENWKIINYVDTESTTNIKFGDIISFENNHFTEKFLSGFPDYQKLTTMDAMQDFERWRLVNSINPTSTAEVTASDTFLLQLVNNNGSNYAKVDGGGIQNTVPLSNLGSNFRFIQTSVS